MTADPPGVLAIIGDVRTGSTLLQGLLSRHAQVATVGELRRLDRFVRENRACSCGVAVSDCPHWRDVAARAGRDLAAVRTGRPETRLGQRWEEGVGLAGVALGARSLTRRLIPRGAQVSDNLACLLTASARRAGARIVVDSSKDPGHAVLLLHQSQIPVRVVFLVRDGRAVVWSKIRRTGISAGFATRHWVSVMVAMGALDRAIGRGRCDWVKYEDLCSDPLGSVRRIAPSLDLDCRGWPGSLPAERHDIGGSPGVGDTEFTNVHEDLRWREEMPRDDLATFERFGGFVNRRLGYE